MSDVELTQVSLNNEAHPHSYVAPRDSSARASLTEKVLAVLAVCIPSLLYLTVCWPGFLQADHQSSIAELAVGHPGQMHSLLWTLIAYPLIYLPNSYGWYGLLQIAAFTTAVCFSIFRLRSLRIISKRGMWVLACVFALMPSFLLYNLLYCSGVIFAYCLIPLTVLAIEIVQSEGHCLRRPTFLAGLGLLLYFAFEMRKNAVILFVFVTLICLLAYRRFWKNTLVIAAAVCACIVATSALCTYGLHATNAPSREAFSVPLQQVARTYAEHGDIPQSDRAVFDRVHPQKYWATKYRSSISDPVKTGFNPTPDFFKAWAAVGIKNPKIYAKAYVAQMYPFWEIGDVSIVGFDFRNFPLFTVAPCLIKYPQKCRQHYVSELGSPYPPRQERVVTWFAHLQKDHIPVVSDVLNLVVFNRAVPLWTFVIGLIIALCYRRGKAYFIVSSPLWTALLSLLLTAPTANIRYAMQMQYMLPVLIAWVVFICQQRKSRSESAAQMADGERLI